MAAKEKIIDKITKLMQKAQSAKQLGSLAEAESFLAKANELLLQYNIEESEINLSAGQEAPKITLNTVSFHDNQAGSRWRLKFLQILAEFNFCSIVYRSRSSRGTYQDQHFADVIGKQDNIDVVIYLYHNLGLQLITKAQEDYRSIHKFERPFRYGYLKDWLLGANAGFKKKLIEARNRQRREYGENLTGLILYNDKAIKEFEAQQFPNLKSTKSKQVYVNPETYKKGYQVGQTLEANKAVSDQQSLKKQIKE